MMPGLTGLAGLPAGMEWAERPAGNGGDGGAAWAMPFGALEWTQVGPSLDDGDHGGSGPAYQCRCLISALCRPAGAGWGRGAGGAGGACGVCVLALSGELDLLTVPGLYTAIDAAGQGHGFAGIALLLHYGWRREPEPKAPFVAVCGAAGQPLRALQLARVGLKVPVLAAAREAAGAALGLAALAAGETP